VKKVLFFAFFVFFVMGAAKEVEHGPWEYYKKETPRQKISFYFGAIDPAKVVIDKDDRTGFVMSEADTKIVREAFAGEPLDFIADTDVRSYVSSTTENFHDRDEYRKLLALAAYFTVFGKKGSFRFNMSNLDSILEEFFKRKITVNEAYDEVTILLGYSPLRKKMRKIAEKLKKEVTAEKIIEVFFIFFLIFALVFVAKTIVKKRFLLLQLLNVCFSPRNFFKSSVVIIGAIIAFCMICITLKVCC
jgi:hypothetical protein